MLGSSEWRLCIDDPIMPKERSQKRRERLFFSERFQFTGEEEITVPEGALQTANEFTAKNAAKDLHRKEERVLRANPCLMVRRQTTGWDHAVNVRVDLEVLPPGVKHAEEADICAEMSWIGSNLQQRGGAGLEQEIIDDFLVVKSHPCKFMRDGEDYMRVFDRQQFFASFGEPLIAGARLALGTVPRTAGVE